MFPRVDGAEQNMCLCSVGSYRINVRWTFVCLQEADERRVVVSADTCRPRCTAAFSNSVLATNSLGSASNQSVLKRLRGFVGSSSAPRPAVTRLRGMNAAVSPGGVTVKGFLPELLRNEPFVGLRGDERHRRGSDIMASARR